MPLALDPGWCIDSMFGGALLREAVAAARLTAGLDDWIAVSASVRFLRPMQPGRADAEVEVLHRGRGTCVATARLTQDGRDGVSVLVTFAPEESVPLATPAQPVDLPPAIPPSRDPRAGVAWQVDWRIVGDWGPVDGPLRAWIAQRGATTPPPADWCLVAADLLVPAIAGASRDIPVRFASLSLDVAVLARPASVWMAQEVEAVVVGNSAHASMRLTSPDGSPIARVLHRGVLLPGAAADMPYSATGFGAGVAG